MAREQSTNEANVAKELILADLLGLAEVSFGVGLALLFGCFLHRFKVINQKDFLETTTAEVEEFLAELAELEVVLDGAFTLRLKLDLDDRCADLLTVELRVLLFVLSLAEDGLYDNVEHLVINLEVSGLLLIEILLAEQLAVANEHLAKLSHLEVDVVLSDLVENHSNFLSVIFAGLSSHHVICCSSVNLSLQLFCVLIDRLLVETTAIVISSVTTATATAPTTALTTMIEATAASATATRLMVVPLTSGATHAPLIFLVHHRSVFAFVSASHDSTVDAHSDQGFRLLFYILHLAEQGSEKSDGNLFLGLNLVDCVFDATNFRLIFIGQLVSFDISVRAFDYSLDHEDILFLRRLSYYFHWLRNWHLRLLGLLWLLLRLLRLLCWLLGLLLLHGLRGLLRLLLYLRLRQRRKRRRAWLHAATWHKGLTIAGLERVHRDAHSRLGAFS